MNFSPGFLRVKSHLSPAGKPAPPRPRRFAAFTSATRSSGVEASAARSPLQSPGRISTGSSRTLDHSGSAAGSGAPASTRSSAPGPASTTSPSRKDGLEWQKPRQTVSFSTTAPSAGAHRDTEPGLELADLLVEARRPARGSGADAHDPLGRRLDEVVVEGRDPVDGRLGKPGHRRRVPAVVVGDLPTLRCGFPEDVERRHRAVATSAPLEQLDQVLRHRKATLAQPPLHGRGVLVAGVTYSDSEALPARRRTPPRRARFGRGRDVEADHRERRILERPGRARADPGRRAARRVVDPQRAEHRGSQAHRDRRERDDWRDEPDRHGLGRDRESRDRLRRESESASSSAASGRPTPARRSTR